MVRVEARTRHVSRCLTCLTNDRHQYTTTVSSLSHSRTDEHQSTGASLPQDCELGATDLIRPDKPTFASRSRSLRCHTEAFRGCCIVSKCPFSCGPYLNAGC